MLSISVAGPSTTYNSTLITYMLPSLLYPSIPLSQPPAWIVDISFQGGNEAGAFAFGKIKAIPVAVLEAGEVSDGLWGEVTDVV